jgi:hypothetical protein
MVCVPKIEGELGVLDLQVQNESLLMKHLHKFFNKEQIPWVQLIWNHYYSRNRLPIVGAQIRSSFWWRDIMKLLESYKSSTRIVVQDACLLWTNLWKDTNHSHIYPELYSYAQNKHISLSVAHATSKRQTLFHVPLSNEAYH